MTFAADGDAAEVGLGAVGVLARLVEPDALESRRGGHVLGEEGAEIGLGGDRVLQVGDVQPDRCHRREGRRRAKAFSHDRPQAERRAKRHEQRQGMLQRVRTFIDHDRPERVADDDPRLWINESQHRLLSLLPDCRLGQVPSDLCQGCLDVSFGEEHACACDPGGAGERLEDLALDIPAPHGLGALRILSDVKSLPGLGAHRRSLRRPFRNAFEPLQRKGFGEVPLLGCQVAKVVVGPLEVRRAEQPAVIGRPAVDRVGPRARGPEPVGEVRPARQAHASRQRRQPGRFDEVGRLALMVDPVYQDDRGHWPGSSRASQSSGFDPGYAKKLIITGKCPKTNHPEIEPAPGWVRPNLRLSMQTTQHSHPHSKRRWPAPTIGAMPSRC